MLSLLTLPRYNSYIRSIFLSNDMSDTQSQQQSPTTALQPGITAPDFTLHYTPNQSISLNQYHGNPVILVFYPATFHQYVGMK